MRPARPWQLEPTLRFLAVLPLAIAVTGLLIQVAARLAGETTGTPPVWLTAASTGAMHFLMVALIFPLLRAHDLGWKSAFGFFGPGWPRTWLTAAGWTLPALGVAWLIHQGCGWLLDFLAVPHDSQAAVDAVRGADRLWERGLLFLFAVMTAPFVEETLFRGVLWPFVRDRGWRIAGALGVSLLFAVIHYNLAALIPLWFLGLFWTWLYERTEDLTAPILSHALFNASNFLWIILAGSDSMP